MIAFSRPVSAASLRPRARQGYRVTGYTQTPWTAGQADEIIAPLEQLLGRPPAEMQAFLRAYPETSLNGDVWGNRLKGPDNVRIGYYFRHSMQPARPFLATFYMDWNLPRKERENGTEPIKPPPGFEGFDMRPPDVQEYEKWKKANGAESALISKEAGPVSSPPNPGGLGFLSFWWLWLPLFVIVAVLVRRIGQSWIKRKKGN